MTNSGALACFAAGLNLPLTGAGRTIFLWEILNKMAKVSFALLQSDNLPVPIYQVFSETSIDQTGFYQGDLWQSTKADIKM